MADHSAAHDHDMEEDDSDSYWDYEYHDTETESFYVTVDLSSATNSYRPRKQKDPKEPLSADEATAERANNSSTPNTNAPNVTAQQEENLDAPDPVIQQEGENFEGNEASPAPDRIQILDLHSPNPMISYQNQIYSCEWTSTIGTDVLLTIPDPDSPEPVLKAEPGVSVLAATRIKLFGRPVQIATRDDQEATPAVDQATPVKIPVNIASRKARQNQAKFLERLIAIKAAKGEKDEVTVYAQKANQGSRRRSQQQERRASEHAEAVMAENDGSTPTTPTVRRASTRGRGRASRARGANSRRSGPRTKKGGLFKDYRPQLFPTESADMRSQSSVTPTSWDQLSPSPSRIGEHSNIIQPTNANPFSTPHSVPSAGYHPPASRPNIDPQSTDHMNIDTVPNAPPDPGEASRNPDVDPMHALAPLMAESVCERKAFATGHGAAGPSLVGDGERDCVGGGDGGGGLIGDEERDSVGGGDGGGGLIGAVERNCGNDVETEDG